MVSGSYLEGSWFKSELVGSLYRLSRCPHWMMAHIATISVAWTPCQCYWW